MLKVSLNWPLATSLIILFLLLQKLHRDELLLICLQDHLPAGRSNPISHFATTSINQIQIKRKHIKIWTFLEHETFSLSKMTESFFFKMTESFFPNHVVSSNPKQCIRTDAIKIETF